MLAILVDEHFEVLIDIQYSCTSAAADDLRTMDLNCSCSSMKFADSNDRKRLVGRHTN